jgi:nitrous oxidase accessory protein NosD
METTEFFLISKENVISEKTLRDNIIGIAMGTSKDKRVNDNIVTGN